MVWADSVASLFTAAARRAATSPCCQKHAVIARTALCTPVAVLYSTLGRAIIPVQANAAAAGGRNCFFHSHGFDLSSNRNIAQSCWPCPNSRYTFRLRPNIGGSLGTAASLQSQRRLSEPGRWVGTLLRFGPARPRAKRRTSFASGALCNSAALRLEPSSMFPAVIAVRGVWIYRL